MFAAAILVLFVACLSRIAAVGDSRPQTRLRLPGTARPPRDELLADLIDALPYPVVVVNGQVELLAGFEQPIATGGPDLLDRLDESHRSTLRGIVGIAHGRLEAQTVRLVLSSQIYDVTAVPLPRETFGPGAAALLFRDATAEQQHRDRLEQLAKRNDLILRNAMDGFFVVDDAYRFVEVNDAFCRMTGYSADELRQVRMSELEVNEPPRGISGTLARTGLHHLATVYRHRNGGLIQLEISAIVLRDEGRKLLVGFARDVTERVAAEERLAEERNFIGAVLDTTAALVLVLDRDGRLLRMNQAAERAAGRRSAALRGRCPWDVFADRDEAGLMRKALEELAAGAPRVRFETGWTRSDGERCEVAWVCTALHDRHGAVQNLVCTGTDVTDRNLAERALRASHERYESLVDYMPLGYVVSAPDQRIQDWNAAARVLFQYELGEIHGESVLKLAASPRDAERLAAAWQKLSEGAPHADLQLACRRRDGAEVECEWTLTALRAADGALECVAALVRDVSERQRLEAQLRQSQKTESLGLLAGGVAHDFNNFLVSILCNASLAAERIASDAPVQQQLQRVINGARRASDLTRQMLTYAGAARVELRAVELDALVRELADLLRAAVPKHIELRTAAAAGLPPIDADPAQVQQVIMNLLINAAEAIGQQPGSIDLDLRAAQLSAAAIARELPQFQVAPGEYVELVVRDSGCGMSAETQARIFDPFFTTKFTGRGLGLATTLGIIRSHRGAVRVASAPGRGTAFHVFLPVSTQAAHAAAAPPVSAALPPGATVLVIDDEEDIREVVASVLEDRGARVLQAESGPAGLRIFAEQAGRIDAVLLDMTMPGMKGDAVFRELLAQRADVRVILSSGYTEQDAAARFADPRLAGFIQKPYTADALAAKIAAVITAPRAG